MYSEKILIVVNEKIKLATEEAMTNFLMAMWTWEEDRIILSRTARK